MELGIGTAAGATDIRTKSRSTGWRDSERTGDCSWAGRQRWVMKVSGSDASVLPALPVLSSFQSR
jgi:hypothetical protein